MDYSSSDDSSISDTDIAEYVEKPYEALRTNQYKVMNRNGTLRCPFCSGKKKQEYGLKDLYQHSSGVAKGAAHRRGLQKANHLALAKYLELDLGYIDPYAPQTSVEPEPIDQQETFCWPWVGIIDNILDDESRDKVLTKYSYFGVEFFQEEGEIVRALVKFGKDWNAYKKAVDFEKFFGACKKGKEWINNGERVGKDIYGWLAREEEYCIDGKIGDYLRKNTEIKTLAVIDQELKHPDKSRVANLKNEIDLKKENLTVLSSKVIEKILSYARMMEDKDKMEQAFNEESRRIQRNAQQVIRRAFAEQEKMNEILESEKRQLDQRVKELSKRDALTELELRKLNEEKRKNDERNKSLQMASIEQQKADENVLRLIQQQKVSCFFTFE
ncbi:hypothetical protein vseg_013945 [Gypsophila vaccaria]